MKTDDFGRLLAATTASLAVVCLVITIAVILQSQDLRQELRELRRQASEAATEANRARQEQVATEASLAAQRERLARLEAEITAAQAKAATNRPTLGQPTRVHVYQGNRYLGQGWALPLAGTNTAYPTVALDERAGAAPMPAGTGAAERDGAGAYSLAYHYYQQFPGYGWWPALWLEGGAGTNRQTVTPPPPATPPNPPPPATPPAVRISTPTIVRDLPARVVRRFTFPAPDLPLPLPYARPVLPFVARVGAPSVLGPQVLASPVRNLTSPFSAFPQGAARGYPVEAVTSRRSTIGR